MNKVLVFGDTGQVAQALKKTQPQNIQAVYVGRSLADFEDLGSVLKVLQDNKAPIVINCVGYTSVDRAEDDKLTCYKVNTEVPGYIAKWCRMNDASLIHLSTDYVFDGSKKAPYIETDETNPLNIYGRSKRDSENIILSENPKSYILRTSWVYSEDGVNFVNTMLKLREKAELRIVNDQIGSPTYAQDLARALWSIVQHQKFSDSYGIYHCSGGGQTNWFEFAQMIFELAEGKNPQLIPVSTREYGAKALRPSFSKLETSKIKDVFGVELPDWKDSLRLCLKNSR